MVHVVPSPRPALMIVRKGVGGGPTLTDRLAGSHHAERWVDEPPFGPKAVAGVPTCTDRLAGSTDAKSWIDDPAFGTKAALTVVSALSATEQSLVPLHPPPLHPAKVEPLSAAALTVTSVLGAKLAVQEG